MNRITFLFALWLTALSLTANAADPTRILFIGNSYTGQIRNTITGLIEAAPEGKTTELEFITPGGKTLEFHLQNEATTKRIAEGNWDFVVLQDQSQNPALHPKQFEAAAIKLDQLIDAAGAKTVFYQTWGRRDGDKANPKLFPTYEKMQEKLSKNYRSVAKSCNAILAPVGETWARVRKTDQKLGTELYKKDGSHPSGKGAYLAACVFYVTIFEKQPDSITFKGSLSQAESETIVKAIR